MSRSVSGEFAQAPVDGWHVGSGRRCARQLGGDISLLGFDGFLVLSLMECPMIALFGGILYVPQITGSQDGAVPQNGLYVINS